jgi:hypothetical protein
MHGREERARDDRSSRATLFLTVIRTMYKYQFLIEELQLWGVGRTGRDIPARGARETVKNEWCQPS